MNNHETCIRCNSKNLDKLFVNTRISLNYPEEKNQYTSVMSQRIINPTDALVCNDCGHIEFLFIPEKEGI